MARPKSEDKKQALLEAATAAFAQSGIAASTSAIARSAGVAEGTLFRATKDELLNELYLAIKLRLRNDRRDPDEKRPKENAQYLEQLYRLGRADGAQSDPPDGAQRAHHRRNPPPVRELSELNEMCQLSVKEIFLSEAYRAFGDALFVAGGNHHRIRQPRSAAPGRLSPSALKPCGTPCRADAHDAGTLHPCAHRIALTYRLPNTAGPGPEYDVFKVDGRIFMITMTIRGRALVNLKAEPQKSLLNQQIYRVSNPATI